MLLARSAPTIEAVRAVRDLESRLKVFADGALDEVAVVGGLIDLETSALEEIEAFKTPDISAQATEDAEA